MTDLAKQSDAVERHLDRMRTHMDVLMDRFEDLSRKLERSADKDSAYLAILYKLCWATFTRQFRTFLYDCQEESRSLARAFDMEAPVGEREFAPILIPIEGKLCPDCEQQLMRYANETERYGIILGHCEECGGVFALSKEDVLE